MFPKGVRTVLAALACMCTLAPRIAATPEAEEREETGGHTYCSASEKDAGCGKATQHHGYHYTLPPLPTGGQAHVDHNSMGVDHLEAHPQDYSGALKFFRAATLETPDSPAVWTNVGIGLAEQCNPGSPSSRYYDADEPEMPSDATKAAMVDECMPKLREAVACFDMSMLREGLSIFDVKQLSSSSAKDIRNSVVELIHGVFGEDTCVAADCERSKAEDQALLLIEQQELMKVCPSLNCQNVATRTS